MIEREDENNEEETVLKITDKRKFKLDGSLRDGVIIEPEPEKKEVKSEPTRESVISQTESEEAKPPEQQHTSADEEANEDEILGANDPASFINFLSTLVSQAAASLGAMPHPATGQKEVNLEAAKHWINVLSMLKEKTEGNLHSKEQQLFDGLMSDLQLQYVTLSRASEEKLKTQAAQQFSSKDILGR